MRIKRRDAEQWMCHRMLPEYLKERIRRYEQYKWQEGMQNNGCVTVCSSNLPISTSTIETITEVEAFALMHDDLKIVAFQFRRLINRKQLQHTFR
ncbi:cyclic nucleotide-gated ion channel [Trifolium repens]|nr:cyclic nucleotide-gated ion channel [Trifolium repens]